MNVQQGKYTDMAVAGAILVGVYLFYRYTKRTEEVLVETGKWLRGAVSDPLCTFFHINCPSDFVMPTDEEMRATAAAIGDPYGKLAPVLEGWERIKEAVIGGTYETEPLPGMPGVFVVHPGQVQESVPIVEEILQSSGVTSYGFEAARERVAELRAGMGFFTTPTEVTTPGGLSGTAWTDTGTGEQFFLTEGMTFEGAPAECLLRGGYLTGSGCSV